MDEATFAQELGTRLRLARQTARLSQEQAARRAGIARNYLSTLEGGGSTVSAWIVGRLAAAYGQPVGYFYGEPLTPHAQTEAAINALTPQQRAWFIDVGRMLHAWEEGS